MYTIPESPATKQPPPDHARRLLIFIRASGGETFIGPHSLFELADDYGLSEIDVAAAGDYLAITGLVLRDGARIRLREARKS